MVGGIAALIGAIMLGARIGKYVKGPDGKVVKINAIPGHSIPLGALGVFILWLGWYGFNGAAATSPSELSSIFLTTTIAPAVATCTTMIYTWKKNGKPDVSMCLNASLAGLVAITAGCDAMDAVGAIVVGIVSGILVVVVVETLDLKLHVDDPVGAVGVHMANGMWGTLAVGLLANPDAPAGVALSEGAVTVGIRPEGFDPEPDGELKCGLTAVEVMGRDTSIVATNAAAANGSIRTIVDTEELRNVSGDTVNFRIKPSRIYLFDKESGKRVRCTFSPLV